MFRWYVLDVLCVIDTLIFILAPSHFKQLAVHGSASASSLGEVAVKWLGAFPGIAPRLAVHTATAGHPVDSHYGSILSHLLYSMARQWLHQPKGPLHRPNQTKVQDTLKGRRSASGRGLAGPGRDGTAVIPARRPAGPAGRPAHSAQRHFDGHTFGLSPSVRYPPRTPTRPTLQTGAEAFRRPHLRFEPPACDTPTPPHPDRHGKQGAAGLLISEVWTDLEPNLTKLQHIFSLYMRPSAALDQQR